MLRVGIVDYDLSRSHADPFLRILREEHAGEVTVESCWAMLPEPSKEWADKRGVAWAHSAREVAASSDAVLLLAPNHPQYHLQLAEEVFPEAGRVFVDKTFADTVANAEAIDRLAAREGVRYFSSSALRYAPALVETIGTGELDDAFDLEMRGPGTWDNYGVHVVEPVVRVFGTGITAVRASGRPEITRVELGWEDGRTAFLCVNRLPRQPFEMRATTPRGIIVVDLSPSTFYNRLLDAVVAFFRTGEPPVAFEETRAVVGVVEDVQKSLAAGRVKSVGTV